MAASSAGGGGRYLKPSNGSGSFSCRSCEKHGAKCVGADVAVVVGGGGRRGRRVDRADDVNVLMLSSRIGSGRRSAAALIDGGEEA